MPELTSVIERRTRAFSAIGPFILFAAALALFVVILLPPATAAPLERPPNIVLIFCDDLGYADVGCFGAKGYKTPNLDRMAREGVRFTDFYVAQPVCSASRAALLTGCYPHRVGILGALGPKSNLGIHSNEVTIAEMLKARGYATAIYGKWHLGYQAAFLPTRHGFDDYFGLPYSNDMWPHHPTSGTNYPPLPLIEGTNVVQLMPDQRQLTTWYTERAVKFIAANKDRPFFLYVPHNMPHVPLHVSDKFAGKTKRGLYGDVIEEIDWSVGEILRALKEHRLDEQTLVLFTSDNGPWLLYGDHAGSAAPHREGKMTTFEGGVRVPFIARWPRHIPARTVCREPAMTIDLFPTFARLAGGKLPAHPIDGLDISVLLFQPRTAKSPHDALFFYWTNRLQAVRSGPWKLVFAHEFNHVTISGTNGKPGKEIKLEADSALFNLEKDPTESTDVAKQNPGIVAKLNALASKAREELGDAATKQKGTGLREPGKVEEAARPR